MADADIGAHGAVWVALEDSYGTVKDPSLDDSDGLWVPVLSETLMYSEPDRYYSEQIRQEAVHSTVKQSYYHVEGEIVMEVDATYMPFFMAASRHQTSKLAGLYTSIPGGQGTTYPGGSAFGLSIAVIRDNVGFLYSGCVVNNWAFTIENGVLRVTMTMLGLADNVMDDDSALSPTWVPPVLYGADAHAIYVDDAGLTPTFAELDATFNGYTFTANHNAEPQNRITRARSATYVKYGITEVSYDTELDFVNRDEYDKFIAAELRAIRFESINPGGVGGDWGSADNGFRITAYNTVYNTYEQNLSGMGDLVMARVNGRGLAIAGGSAYAMECISPTDVAAIP